MVTLTCKGKSCPHTKADHDRYGMMVKPIRLDRLYIAHDLVPDISKYQVSSYVFLPRGLLLIGCTDLTPEIKKYLAPGDADRFRTFGNILYWMIQPNMSTAQEITIHMSDRQMTFTNDSFASFCEFKQHLEMAYALDKIDYVPENV